MFAKRHSTPAPSSRRQSMAQRLSVTLGLAASREAFTVEEAKSPQATDIALRIANKDPSKPCLNDRLYTPLHVAAGLGREEVVRMILDKDNSSVNAVAKLGLTPLIVAAGSRQWKIVQMLIAAGANLESKDSSERTAYDIAVEEKAPDAILVLLIPVKDKHPKFNQATPFSSIVMNESITINMRGDA